MKKKRKSKFSYLATILLSNLIIHGIITNAYAALRHVIFYVLYI